MEISSGVSLFTGHLAQYQRREQPRHLCWAIAFSLPWLSKYDHNSFHLETIFLWFVFYIYISFRWFWLSTVVKQSFFNYLYIYLFKMVCNNNNKRHTSHTQNNIIISRKFYAIHLKSAHIWKAFKWRFQLHWTRVVTAGRVLSLDGPSIGPNGLDVIPRVFSILFLPSSNQIWENNQAKNK